MQPGRTSSSSLMGGEGHAAERTYSLVAPQHVRRVPCETGTCSVSAERRDMTRDALRGVHLTAKETHVHQRGHAVQRISSLLASPPCRVWRGKQRHASAGLVVPTRSRPAGVPRLLLLASCCPGETAPSDHQRSCSVGVFAATAHESPMRRLGSMTTGKRSWGSHSTRTRQHGICRVSAPSRIVRLAARCG